MQQNMPNVADQVSAYCLKMLKYSPIQIESQKMMFLYFIVSSLDVVNELSKIDSAMQHQIVDFVLAQQSPPNTEVFSGGFFSGEVLAPAQKHIVFTYSALCILKVFKQEITADIKQKCLQHLISLRLENGCFMAHAEGDQRDLRFVYAAVAISALLNDFQAIDCDKTIQYILSCREPSTGGFALREGLEAHGGATYCAIASLHLLGKLQNLPMKARLLNFLVNRQNEHQFNYQTLVGFNGRVNKVPDSCYSFWVGASLHLLGFSHLIDGSILQPFMQNCTASKGGYSKYPFQISGDPVHTLHSLYGLQLLGLAPQHPTECAINFALGIRADKV